MKKVNLPARQIHLDFHTSEYLPGIGKRFSKENFQAALQLGHVNSITVFAKCHHSWCYYPTKVGKMHPALDFDLTGAMIEAAHEIGVKAPVYITVGWSSNDAERPEWVKRDKNGKPVGSKYDLNASGGDPKPIVSWKYVCPGNTYGDHIYELTKEICARYPDLDGLFYDINFDHGKPCYCQSCRQGMLAEGLNPENDEHAQEYLVLKWQRFMEKCRQILLSYHPEATLFFNGSANPLKPEWHSWQTHFEMEDLPTTWGGYDRMPLRAKYFAKTGKEYIGQSGKFHTMWGEFGGYKTGQAIRYETAAILAFGGRVAMGDQMHPSGAMDLESYRLIGEGYEYARQIEEWCFHMEQTSRLGVYLSPDTTSNEGLAKILLDTQHDFDVVNCGDDLARYDLLVLPDEVPLDQEEAERISNFVQNGGSVLLTARSGLDAAGQKFMLDVGANYQGVSNYKDDYLELRSPLVEGLVASPFICYEAAQQVWLTDGEVLADIREPYFNRTYEHYCSHQNTPYKLEKANYPGAIRKGRIIYLAHPVCRLYFQHGAQIHRDYFINALRLLYQDPVAKVDLPSSGRINFVRQKEKNRYVLHLLYATPIKRGRALVIEDLPPIYDVPVTVRIPEKVKGVYLAPQRQEIPYKQGDGKVTLTVPQVRCHQMVVFDY